MVKRNRILFWVGMLVAGIAVYGWLRRRLAEAEMEQHQPPAGDLTPRAPEAVAPAEEASEPPQTAEEPDDLQEIAGIGPVFSRRLQAAGVQTFAGLAALSPDQVREKAKAEPWQADTAAWVAQAREKAAG